MRLPSRAIPPFAAILLLFLLNFSVSYASPRDNEATSAQAAPVPPSSAPTPSPSAKSVLGSNTPSNASFLFTIVSRKATLEADPNHNDTVILRLLDPNPHVLWFTDKPQRAAGAIDTEIFLGDAFRPGGTGPWLGEPNAVVLASGPGLSKGKYGTDDEAAVVTLRDPKIDKGSGAMTFRAEIIRIVASDPSASDGEGGGATDRGEKKRKEKDGDGRYSARVSSQVARNYLKAGERRPEESKGGENTHLLSSPPKKKVTWANVQVFIDDYYLEQPASPAPPPPPPPTVVVVQAPAPPPPPPSSSYQSSIWNRIDGPQPIDAYSCSFMGGCGFGGVGGFGLGGFG